MSGAPPAYTESVTWDEGFGCYVWVRAFQNGHTASFLVVTPPQEMTPELRESFERSFQRVMDRGPV